MKTSTRRIFVVAATVAIQLAVGVVYVWSAFQTGVTYSLFGGNNAHAGLTFSLLLACLTISSVFGGKIAARLSTRFAVVLGGVIVATGFLLSGFVRTNGWLLWLTYGVMGGIGLGFGYSTSIACVQKWFPNKKGLITGIVVAALGFGTVLFAPLVNAMIISFGVDGQGGENYTFMVLAAILLAVCVTGGIFLKNPPEGYMQEVVDANKADCDECKDAQSLVGAVSDRSLEQLEADEQSSVGSDDLSLQSTVSPQEDNCPVCEKPPVYAHHHTVTKIKKRKPSEFVVRNLGSMQMLKTPYYYLITIALLLACMSGLMVINFAQPIAVLRGFRGTAATAAIVAVGLSNSGGRLLWGAVSDKFGRLNTLFVLLGATALLAPFVVIAPGGSIFVFLALIGLCYGGILSIFPVLTAELFGAKNLATNYGFVLLGFGVGAIIASQIAGLFADIARYYYDVAYMLPAFLIAMGCAIGAGLLLLPTKILNWRRNKKARLLDAAGLQ